MTPLEIMLRSREFESEETVKQYMDDFDSKSVEEVMANINLYAHQQMFAVALDDLVSQSIKMVKEDNFLGWVELMRSLQYPILISSLIQFIDTSHLCVALMGESMKWDDKMGKLITGILRYHWLSMIYRENPGDNEASVVENIKAVVSRFLTYFGTEEVVKWCIGLPEMKERLVNNDTLRHDRYVDAIRDFLYSAVDLSGLSTRSDNFEYLVFLCQAYQVREGNHDEELNEILDNIISVLTHQRYFWRNTLSVSTVTKMRAVRNVIAKGGAKKWEEVLNGIKVHYEGYRCPSLSDAYNRVDGECWIYCCLLLLAECDDNGEECRMECFWRTAMNVLSQCHVCDNSHLIETDYQTVLCMAELIVAQLLKDLRATYEEALLDSNMPLRYVVRVLENCNEPLADTVFRKLQDRKSKEWRIEKLRLSQIRMQDNIIKEVESFFLQIGMA